MKIFIDKSYHCHLENDGTMREIETDEFNGREAMIEGYCYDDSKGYVSVYPWKNYADLVQAQRDYDVQMIKAALSNIVNMSREEFNLLDATAENTIYYIAEANGMITMIKGDNK